MTTRVLIALVALVLAAAPAQPADPKDELRVAIPWTPENLDPTMNLSSIRAQVGVSLFDSLVGRDAENWMIYLGLNAFKKPLSDIRVRQALNYATDVDAIVKNVLEGNGRRAPGPLTPHMFGYDPSVKGYPSDPARARRLLAEAGYPDGLEITLNAPEGRYQGDKEIAEALAGQWQRAGFKPKVQVAEWGAYFKRYLAKQFSDAYLLGLGGPMQDGDELFNLVSSKGRGLYYKNEKVDIYAMRDRVEWTPRPDQWMLLHRATLK